jgi:hypothetical protein
MNQESWMQLVVGMQWADPGFNMNLPTKPSDTDPLGITLKKVKSHPRYLWELQEPSLCSGEGMGGKHHKIYI